MKTGMTIARRERDPLASLRAAVTELERSYTGSAPRHAGSRSIGAAPREADRRRAAARQLHFGAALLSLSVLADSGIEHYRGSFQNRAMYVPLGVSTLTLAASLFGAVDARARSHALRDGLYALAAATGAVGIAFHGYNISKRPGGLSWLNLFYAAPVGAPAALALAGALGRGAERTREHRSTLLGRPIGRTLSLVTSAGLAGTVAEAGLLHFRGAFQNPGMYLPIAVPPLAAGLLAASVIRPSIAIRSAAKACLKLTALVGFAGVAFHLYGIARQMGGLRNWSQNLLNGPPLPAPPSFTGLALSGLAALSLTDKTSETHRNDRTLSRL